MSVCHSTDHGQRGGLMLDPLIHLLRYYLMTRELDIKDAGSKRIYYFPTLAERQLIRRSSTRVTQRN